MKIVMKWLMETGKAQQTWAKGTVGTSNNQAVAPVQSRRVPQSDSLLIQQALALRNSLKEIDTLNRRLLRLQQDGEPLKDLQAILLNLEVNKCLTNEVLGQYQQTLRELEAQASTRFNKAFAEPVNRFLDGLNLLQQYVEESGTNDTFEYVKAQLSEAKSSIESHISQKEWKEAESKLTAVLADKNTREYLVFLATEKAENLPEFLKKKLVAELKGLGTEKLIGNLVNYEAFVRSTAMRDLVEVYNPNTSTIKRSSEKSNLFSNLEEGHPNNFYTFYKSKMEALISKGDYAGACGFENIIHMANYFFKRQEYTPLDRADVIKLQKESIKFLQQLDYSKEADTKNILESIEKFFQKYFEPIHRAVNVSSQQSVSKTSSVKANTNPQSRQASPQINYLGEWKKQLQSLYVASLEKLKEKTKSVFRIFADFKLPELKLTKSEHKVAATRKQPRVSKANASVVERVVTNPLGHKIEGLTQIKNYNKLEEAVMEISNVLQLTSSERNDIEDLLQKCKKLDGRDLARLSYELDTAADKKAVSLANQCHKQLNSSQFVTSEERELFQQKIKSSEKSKDITYLTRLNGEIQTLNQSAEKRIKSIKKQATDLLGTLTRIKSAEDFFRSLDPSIRMEIVGSRNRYSLETFSTDSNVNNFSNAEKIIEDTQEMILRDEAQITELRNNWFIEPVNELLETLQQSFPKGLPDNIIDRIQGTKSNINQFVEEGKWQEAFTQSTTIDNDLTITHFVAQEFKNRLPTLGLTLPKALREDVETKIHLVTSVTKQIEYLSSPVEYIKEVAAKYLTDKAAALKLGLFTNNTPEGTSTNQFHYFYTSTVKDYIADGLFMRAYKTRTIINEAEELLTTILPGDRTQRSVYYVTEQLGNYIEASLNNLLSTKSLPEIRERLTTQISTSYRESQESEADWAREQRSRAQGTGQREETRWGWEGNQQTTDYSQHGTKERVEDDEDKKVHEPPTSTYNRWEEYYKTLGLREGATFDDVKRAYRRLARKYHPDVTILEDKTAAMERFKEVGRAYEKLKTYLEEIKI